MRIIAGAQHSPEWVQARLGIPTASRFGDIFSPQGAFRSGVKPRQYALELVGERLTGLPAERFKSAAMERGTLLEPRARAHYEFERGVKVRQVGLVMHDTFAVGCSPDGMIGELRGLEIKCPLRPTFLDISESGAIPEEHVLQIQCGLWITKAQAWDYMLYTDEPGLQPTIIEVAPNRDLHAAFDKFVPLFLERCDEIEKKLRERGHGNIVAPAPLPTWDEIITQGNNE